MQWPVYSPTGGARLSDCSALYTSAERLEYSPHCSILSLSPDPAPLTCPASEVSRNTLQHSTATTSDIHLINLYLDLWAVKTVGLRISVTFNETKSITFLRNLSHKMPPSNQCSSSPRDPLNIHSSNTTECIHIVFSFENCRDYHFVLPDSVNCGRIRNMKKKLIGFI